METTPNDRSKEEPNHGPKGTKRKSRQTTGTARRSQTTEPKGTRRNRTKRREQSQRATNSRTKSYQMETAPNDRNSKKEPNHGTKRYQQEPHQTTGTEPTSNQSTDHFFFLRLPNGQYGPVSQLSRSEKCCTGPFNWGGAHCAGEKVKRKIGQFQRKSL